MTSNEAVMEISNGGWLEKIFMLKANDGPTYDRG
jgi:hypothetical protein